MKNTLRKSIFGVVLAVLIGALGWYLWQQFAVDKSAQDFVSSNGRLEATEIKVAAKMAGRVDKILVNEGDLVQQNDVLAVMELTALQAQLLQAQAEAARADTLGEGSLRAEFDFHLTGDHLPSRFRIQSDMRGDKFAHHAGCNQMRNAVVGAARIVGVSGFRHQRAEHDP